MNFSGSQRLHTMSPRRTQGGAALFVAMIMVLLLLVIAVAGMRTVTLESRIGGNMLQGTFKAVIWVAILCAALAWATLR